MDRGASSSLQRLLVFTALATVRNSTQISGTAVATPRITAPPIAAPPFPNALGAAPTSSFSSSFSDGDAFPDTGGLCPTGGCLVAAVEPFLISYTQNVSFVPMTATVIPYITQYGNGIAVTSYSTQLPVFNATGLVTDAASLTWDYNNVTLTYPTTYGVYTDFIGGLEGITTVDETMDGTAPPTVCTDPLTAILDDPRTTDLASFIFPTTAVENVPQQVLDYIANLPEVTPHYSAGTVSSKLANCRVTTTTAAPATAEPSTIFESTAAESTAELSSAFETTSEGPPPLGHVSVVQLVLVTGTPIHIQASATALPLTQPNVKPPLGAGGGQPPPNPSSPIGVPNNPGGGGNNGQPQPPGTPTPANNPGGGGNNGQPQTPGTPTPANGPSGGGNGQQPQSPGAVTTLTINNQPITISSGPSGVIFDGSTIIPNQSTTINGIPVFLPVTGSVVLVDSTLPVPLPTPTPQPAVITIGSATITANPTGGFVLGPGTTLTAGGVVTVDGTRVSLSPGETFLLVGSSTISLAEPTGAGAGAATPGIGGYVASGLGITASPTFQGGAGTVRGGVGRGLVVGVVGWWVLGIL